MLERKIKSAIDDIGTLIDATAFDLGRWQAVVDEFIRVLPGTKAAMQVVDPALARAAPMVAAGWDAPSLNAYATHFGAINPWLPGLMAAPVKTVLYSGELLPLTTLHGSAFFHDFLKPVGEVDASTGMKLVEHGGRLGAFTLSHAAREVDRIRAGGARILEALAPRMRRSLDIARTCAAASWPKDAFSLVDAMVEPTLLVTRQGCLVQANAAAIDLIAAGDVARLGAGDRVQFIDATLSRMFAAGLQVACSTGGSHERDPVSGVPVTTRSGRFALTVLGLRPDMMRIQGMTTLLAAGDLALVVIQRHRSGAADVGRLLRDRYGLSPSEARLALAMDGSRSLPVVAQGLGITHETARSHLKRIFAKLGVSRQSELIAFLMALRQRQ